MTMDHRLREAVDAFVARLRRDLDAHVLGLQADLARVNSENQEYWRTTLERGVTDARQDAERGFKARLEALRNELTREMDVRVASERSQLQAATAAATKAAAEAAEAARLANAQQSAAAEAAAEAAEATRLANARRAEAAEAVAEAAEATRLANTRRAEAAEAVAEAAEATRLANARQAAAAEASAISTQPDPQAQAREARIETLERLLVSVRRIDGAHSLSEILDALAEGVGALTSRVTILVVDGDDLRPLISQGFAHGQKPHDLSIPSSGLLTATIALGQTSFVKPLIVREINTPSFMHVPVGHTGLVVPMAVGGEVVAVLYADDVGRTEVREDAPAWTDEVDLLVRHAAVRLENITSHRTSEVLGS